jgi:alkylated DNA repair dioxygenase AlkB
MQSPVFVVLLPNFQNNLAPFDGELYLIEQFYRPPESDRWFEGLKTALPWQEETLWICGKSCKAPRLMCWYGDPDAHYRYSGVDHRPNPWTEDLLAIKNKIESAVSWRFNSVLANLYRDGKDSMGFHADNEKELGQNPVIASLSLGEERLFKLRHKKRKEMLAVRLGHGDLLVMAGVLQHHWLHSLPKTAQTIGPRINLTFRKIIVA